MGRGKFKTLEKQKVDECSNKKGTEESEIRENPPIVRNQDVKKKEKEEKERLDQGRDMSGKNDSFKNGEDKDKEEAAESAEARLATDEEIEAKEIWDIIRVIPTAEENIECRYEHCSGQAIAIWASDKHPWDKWPLCEKCQLEDFDGWPDDVEPIERNGDIIAIMTRTETMGDESVTVKNEISTPVSEATTRTTATVTTSSTDLCKGGNDIALQRNAGKLVIAPTERDIKPLEEKYELSGIIPLEKLLGNPTKCSDDACDLPACSVWTSTNDPKKWYYCLDCQERDFDGWPPSNELPCDYLQPEHVRAIATKCSGKRNPVMPVITSKFVTPPPNPSLVPKGTASVLQVVHRSSKAYIPKVSHAAVARHEKWQADAKKLGVNRIIVRKNEAKKIIFDALYDAFRPINFNCIYTVLKKMIPPPVLKAALEDMSLDWRDDETFEASDADSNDDDDNKEGTFKRKRSYIKEAYTGSLIFKAGKNIASSLYYVDHTKIKELNSEEREGINARVSNTKVEHEHLQLSLKRTETNIAQLLIEPMNDELIGLSSELENNVAILDEKVKDARVLTINESHKNSLKRRIQSMAGHYRKRKQLCCSFLSSLEEISDGTISKKKCLAGAGQIALDSDESVNKAAIAYAKSKKRLIRKKISLADEFFVGIALDSQRMIERVYVDEE